MSSAQPAGPTRPTTTAAADTATTTAADTATGGSATATGTAEVVPPARQRRHTLYFLDEIRSFAPVHLDTEVDMAAVLAHRAAARSDGTRYSLVSYVLLTAGRVLARHPEANAAIRGRLRPRVARYPSVAGKLVLDRRLDGRRVVLATVVPDLDRADLDTVQQQIDHHRGEDASARPEVAPLRRLHRLHPVLGLLAYRATVRPLRARAGRIGTFAVSSLGHAPVDGFHSVGGTTITLGVGRVVDRVVARDGRPAVAPVLRLNLTFDHRVVDGAEAAEVLGGIKQALEEFPVYLPPGATSSAGLTADGGTGGTEGGGATAATAGSTGPAATDDSAAADATGPAVTAR
ncbi:2-oxo acid dehydrogenase subunit E2 [Kitasatospora sp. NPDC101176]|uniref:2-oxo acid dehydrogenase subunit E2 n=1 Tax=Kitasatospora sp. NPDC101176 TaxID=3364099 RepID=UPI003802582D